MLNNLDIYTDLCSAFPFENYLQLIKRLVRSRKNRLAQVVKQLEERKTGKILETTQIISTRKPNNAFVLNDSSCCEVTVLGEESDDHHTHSMYTRCVEGLQYIY